MSISDHPSDVICITSLNVKPDEGFDCAGTLELQTDTCQELEFSAPVSEPVKTHALDFYEQICANVDPDIEVSVHHDDNAGCVSLVYDAADLIEPGGIELDLTRLPEVHQLSIVYRPRALSTKSRLKASSVSCVVPPTSEPITYVRTNSCQDWYILTATLTDPSDSASKMRHAITKAYDAQAIAKGTAPHPCPQLKRSNGLPCVRQSRPEHSIISDNFDRKRLKWDNYCYGQRFHALDSENLFDKGSRLGESNTDYAPLQTENSNRSTFDALRPSAPLKQIVPTTTDQLQQRRLVDTEFL